MKIAIFTDLYTPWAVGGIISSIRAQKAELERLGHEVVVFCPGFAGESTEKNVICVPSHRFVKINGAAMSMRPPIVEEFLLAQYPELNKFDVVHVHYEASCSLAGVRLAKKFGIPLVQTMHGREDIAVDSNIARPLQNVVAGTLKFLHGKYLPHESRIECDNYQAPTRARAKMWELMVGQAQQADVVLTPSGHFAKKLKRYGVTKPVSTVSNGVSNDAMKADCAKRELGADEELRMIWNSRVSNEKRMMPFLRALRLLKRPYRLYVYGDGNAEREAKKYVRKHGLNVEFFGVRPWTEIVERMKMAHLGVLASYNFDTQGMVLLEAEATGLPVFLCDPDLTEPLPEGGYVLSGASEAEMADALESIPVGSIARMSEVMLQNRWQISQSVAIKKLLEAYELAQKMKK